MFSLLEVAIAIEIIKVIVTAVVEIAKSLGIIEADQTVEEMGDRALQAEEAGIRPENFESYEEYMKAINELTLDPEKSKMFTEEEKQDKGVEILLARIEEKIDMRLESVLREIEQFPKFYTPERIKEYVEVFAKQGVEIDKVSDYLNGYLKQGEWGDIMNIMVEAEKRLSPEKSEQEIREMIREFRK